MVRNAFRQWVDGMLIDLTTTNSKNQTQYTEKGIEIIDLCGDEDPYAAPVSITQKRRRVPDSEPTTPVEGKKRKISANKEQEVIEISSDEDDVPHKTPRRSAGKQWNLREYDDEVSVSPGPEQFITPKAFTRRTAQPVTPKRLTSSQETGLITPDPTPAKKKIEGLKEKVKGVWVRY